MKNLIIYMIFIAFMISCTTKDGIKQLEFSDKKEVLWDGCYSRDFFKPVVGHTLDVTIEEFNNHSKFIKSVISSIIFFEILSLISF